jgi:hypothetical protein
MCDVEKRDAASRMAAWNTGAQLNSGETAGAGKEV